MRIGSKAGVQVDRHYVATSTPRTGRLEGRMRLGGLERGAEGVHLGSHQDAASLKLAAAASGMRSRWGEPSISKPTMNFRIVAERKSGG